jgi:hypothetical protein
MPSRTLRALLALTLLAVTPAPARAAPASASAVALPPPPAGTTLTHRDERTFLVGGKLGYDARLGNGGDGAFVLEADVATPWRTTAAGLALGWALEVRGFMPSHTERAGLASGYSGIEVTPTLRSSFPLGRSLALRTQAGLGVVARWTWAEVDTQFVGRETVSGAQTTLVVRTGLALDWTLRPNLSVAVEPLSLGFDLRGNADWIVAAGATYRL